VRAVAAEARDSGVRGGKSIGLVPETVSERSEQLQKRWRKVMDKFTSALTLGVGYVLGNRAGRERYDQLKQSAAKLAQRPEVQQARERVQAAAGEKLSEANWTGQAAHGERQRDGGARLSMRALAHSRWWLD
jgi:hypothetical protein